MASLLGPLAEGNPTMTAEPRMLLRAPREVVPVVSETNLLVAAADAMRSDVIVTDFAMSGRDGIDSTVEPPPPPGIRIRVISVTVHDRAALVERGRAVGTLPEVHAAQGNKWYPSSRLRGSSYDRYGRDAGSTR